MISMKNTVFFMVLINVLIHCAFAMPVPKVIASIEGEHITLVVKAMPEFEKRGLNIRHYVLKIVEFEDSYVVLFKDPSLPEGHYGNRDLKQFEVEIEKKSLKVKRANFVK